MPYKALIWDVDGTLISTKRLYPEAYRRALAPYVGRELSDDEMFRVPSRSELRFLRAHAGEYYDECLRAFQRHYAELHETHFGGIYPGVLETLAELRRRGIPMGIVTGKSRHSYEVSSAIAGLGQFDVLVMDDDVSEPKPHPEGILATLAGLKIPAADALYVGDSITDVIAAHEAGTAAAAALWSKEGPDRDRFLQALQTHAEAILLTSPEEILRYL